MARPRRRRRRLSMTSLIDVIFLLLLFFMLTSTFSKFSEVELASAGSGGQSLADNPPLFLQLEPQEIHLNGNIIALDQIATSLIGTTPQGTTVLVSIRDGVNAQRLTDLLVALRPFPNITVTVLEA